MRGKERGHGIRLQHSGITPAYAGKSEIFELSHNLKKDHPRLCGEKLASKHVPIDPPRITPAYAGKRDVIHRSTRDI